MRRRLLAVVALSLAGLPAGVPASAQPALRPGHVHVTPAAGAPDTVFVVGFRTPERAGVIGATERHAILTASAPKGTSGCITTVDVRVPDARKGQRVRVTLAPGRLGGHWCTRVYRGEIREIERPHCRHGRACPAFVVLRGIVGRFAFHVSGPAPGAGTGPGGGNPPPSGGGPGPGGGSPPPGGGNPQPPSDTEPPTFGGLHGAFACTPGPQRPGQTTPYTLSWQPANDDQTSASGIAYDVYYATQPSGENFANPTWTTPAGATSFRTPGLPSHGGAYFVVRARDRAGNEDRNTIEKPGIDPCL